MAKQEFINKFNELSLLVSNWIREDLAIDRSWPKIIEIYKYSLLSPGKRIRPVLAILTAEIFGLGRDLVKPFALAVEYLHTSSLIHDDLPALDNDDLRRGRPTCHKVFGEAFALLAGDALIAKAFSLISSTMEIDARIRSALCGLLSEVMLDLCEGQVMDLEAEGRKIGEEKEVGVGDKSLIDQDKLLELRHLKKTGALLTASIVGVTEFLTDEKRGEVRPYLEEFGRKLGLLFQITDDLLDATSLVEGLGKEVGGDERRKLVTYVSVFGVEGARRLAREMVEEGVRAIERAKGVNGERLVEVMRFILEREK